ncbi:RibD family protein [Candidatus Daviesbacteria bacterium]|nr:RibD family protein [Candidatus Daviesbacteria bacterium]
MVYPKLKFPKLKNRPFFYTNFVQTIDGKVQVKKAGYWPIGSRIDYQVLVELRAYADCLIHGGNLAREFGEITLKNLKKTSFKNLRKKIGKTPNLPYYIVTNHGDKFKNFGKSPYVYVTHTGHGLEELMELVKKMGHKYVLVEGGPTLLGSFLKENLIDEIFLTIAPKIFGNDGKSTLTLVEGVLFSPQKIKSLKLVSVKKIESEVFLRYRKT